METISRNNLVVFAFSLNYLIHFVLQTTFFFGVLPTRKVVCKNCLLCCLYVLCVITDDR